MAGIIIRNATIIDGTGAERFAGDVAVDDGHITEVGDVSGSATEEVDATGLVLARICGRPTPVTLRCYYIPYGFRSHKAARVSVGNCGFSLSFPGALWTYLGASRIARSRRISPERGVEAAVNDDARWAQHHPILEVGGNRRPPSDTELEQMRHHVQLAMEQGMRIFLWSHLPPRPLVRYRRSA